MKKMILLGFLCSISAISLHAYNGGQTGGIVPPHMQGGPPPRLQPDLTMQMIEIKPKKHDKKPGLKGMQEEPTRRIEGSSQTDYYTRTPMG